MQSVSITRKDSRANPKETNLTKSVNNGEILALDNESMSSKTLSRKQICSGSTEEHMTKFRKKNHEKYLQYKGYSAKTHGKDESILSPVCINETDINDDVTSDNSENYTWLKGPIYIAGDSFGSGFQPDLLSQKYKVKTFLVLMLETCTALKNQFYGRNSNTLFYTLALTMH